ncbi:extended synaptotagmin-2-like isoform X3 [Ptychodera flava]|uniref:extended synaptotagmin-2-like isoform X3 n=1 Tax=Ptychodera flava TaxID=63121 RepID=UPI003969D6E1
MADKQVDAAAPQAQKSNKTAEQIEEVKKYGIVLGLLVLIWLLGYLDFSISWLLIIFAVWVYKDKTGQSKKLQMKIRSDVVEDEKQAIQAYVADMPSWVYFPDVERAEWLNNIIKQMWPFLGDYVENVLRTTVEPSIKENLPSSLSSFRFETIDLGEKPLRIGGVKVYSEHIKRNEIIMDLDIYYAGDCDIEVGLSRVKAGIEDVQLHGTVRIEMKPLISTVPLIGAMTVYFLNMPELDFNMTNIANILDIPGLSGILRNIIEDQLSQFLVLPNRLVIPITKDIELLKLKFPMPKGVLRIGVEEAKNLMKKDIAVFSKGSSDPYCILHVGGQKFKTETISSTVNPKWEKYFEAIVDEPLGQVVDIELWDEDKGSKDESLGVLSVDIEDIVTKGYIDTWLPLEEAKTGQIHLKLIWLTLSDQVDALEEARIRMRALEETKRLKALVNQQLASSLLSVKLDSAKDLPSKKTITPPSAYCTLSLGHKTKKSKVQKETNDPVWEEAYFFLVQNPSLQSLDVEVLDKKSSKELGKVSVALKQLLDEPDLELEQRFHLEESGPNSFINLKLCLRSIVSPGSKFYGNQIGSVDAVLSPSKGTQSPSNEVASSPAEEPASGNDNEKLDGTSMASSISDAGGVGTSADTTAVINGDMVSAEALAGHTELRRRNVAKSSGEEEDSGLGKVQLTIRYSSQRNKLIVVVHKAENLPPLNSDNTSDPYVRLYLLPDKSKSGRKKTRVIKDELNPVFDETFEFHCNADEAQQRVIDMAVKNSVGMFSQSKSFIGQAYIHLSELDLTKATTVWFPLQGEGSSMDASTPSLASGTAV